MKRSAGVTAAAVVLLIGSALLALGGIVSVLAAFLVKSPPTAQIHPPPQAFQVGAAIVGCLFYLALAGWGVATAIGLFRLRSWARISILVMSALALLVCLVGGLAVSILLHNFPFPHTSQQLLTMQIFMLTVVAIPGAIALWWILLFARKRVRNQFADNSAELPLDAPQNASGRSRPLSITIIAIFLIIGAPSCVGSLLLAHSLALHGLPLWILGVKIAGRGTIFFYVATALIDLALGFGLWRMKPWARTGAIAWGVFSIANIVGMALRAHDFAQTIDSMNAAAAVPVNFHFPAALAPIMFTTAAIPILIALWFLIKRKSAFAPPPALQEG